MKRPHVIVWDLDGTLGDFSALHNQTESSSAVCVRVRPGLPEALQQLRAAGFLHTVLTLATPLYAETVLRATGLRHHFLRVEGLGQRGKGDAAGIGDALGVPANERPHRMLFVGDHPLFDEPADAGVLFHLEPCGLSRPAEQLTRLVLHLRSLGGGSLRQGFERLGASAPWWRRFWPFSRPATGGGLRCCAVPRLGQVVLVLRPDACPVISFADLPQPPAPPAEHHFIPTEVIAQVKAEQTKGAPAP